MTHDTNEPIVRTSHGLVCGIRRRDHEAYLGVPYAAPPIGELRMAPPVPPESWEGVRPCVAYGPTAQITRPHDTPDLIPAPSIPGDDILTVNVFTPAADPSLHLPVLVWIHGGGYEAGSPASPWFNGGSFAREAVVTVTVGYRLGFHGFGVIPDERANRGVLDWIAALEWVQQNIAAFGGDPAQVTIAGQSAGAGAVLTLLGCPFTAGHFRAAWASSPALPVRDRAQAELGTRRLAQRLGVAPTRLGFASVTDVRLQAAQGALRGRGMLPSIARMVAELPIFAPVVDGDLLPQSTLSSLREGNGSEVPLVIGANDDEVPLLAKSLPRWLEKVPLSLALGFAGIRPRATRRAYAQALRNEGVTSALAAVDRSLSDRVFRRVVADVALARANTAAETYAYRFSWSSPAQGCAIHCLDVPFLWDALDDAHVPALVGADPPKTLADQLHGSLVKLIHGQAIGWPTWTLDAREATRVDVTASVAPGGFDAVSALLSPPDREISGSATRGTVPL